MTMTKGFEKERQIAYIKIDANYCDSIKHKIKFYMAISGISIYYVNSG